MAPVVNNQEMPMQETQKMQVRFLGRENPLEEEMVTQSSILTWEIHWTEGIQSMGSHRVGHDLATEHARAND